jgi:acyl-CoA thioesterase-1
MVTRDKVTMTRVYKAIVSIVLLVMMAAAGQAAPKSEKGPVKILALGSSLTQGYGLPPGTEFTVQLQAALKVAGIDAVVTNAGVSGDTSAGGLARLDWSLADHPDAVILELGSNDMLRGTPPAETEKNLRAILDKLKAAHVKVLLTGMHAQRNLGTDYVRQFDAIYPRLAKQLAKQYAQGDNKVLFYPFFLDGVALNPKLNQADGMHPNPAGVKIIVARMLPLVKKLVGR